MLSYEEGFVNQYILKAGGMPAIDTALEDLSRYVNGTYYDSKEARLDEWSPDMGELHELIIAVFTACLLNATMTYQALVGMLAGRIAVQNKIDQAKIVAEVVAVISKSGLIKITRRGAGNSILVSSNYQFKTAIPRVNRHVPLMSCPKPVTQNNDDNLGSMILGGSIKYHEGNICLDHINRMNKIELKLNRDFLCLHEEAPTFDIDTLQKKDQWNKFITDSYDAYINLVRQGNRFWLEHNVDVRGRTYAMNYYVSTQGSSFKKAIVQLAKEEIVEM